jgi:hypothetical protein
MPSKSEPKRPSVIQVGYIPFTVEYLDDKAWEERGLPDGDGGQTHGAKASIVVREPEGQHPIHAKEILLHEVLHACFYASGMTIEGTLRIQDDIEEHVVSRMSPVLLQVLRANPELAAYVMS